MTAHTTTAEPTLITLGNTRLYQGDALAVLASMPENSVDAICTDPPYGLSKEPDIAEVLTHWLAGDDYTHTGNGFMGACLHPDSEILTNVGWLPVEDVTEAHKVCSLNPDTNAIEYVDVVTTHTYPFEGDLLRIAGRGALQVVTPNHKVWTSRGLRRADSLPKMFQMFNQGDWSGGESPSVITIGDTDYNAAAFLAFFGLWLGDGYTVNRKSHQRKQDFIGLCGYKDRELQAMRVACDEMGFRYAETPVVNEYGTAGSQFYIYDKALLEWLKPLGGSHDKFIPNWIFNLDSSLLERLYRGMMDTDGTIQGNGQEVYYTVSDRLADDFQRLCLHTGRSATKTKRAARDTGFGGGGSWTLSVLQAGKTIWLERDGRPHAIDRSQPAAVTPLPYEGLVHCVTLERHHIMLSRLEGKTVWTGNSWDSFVPGPALWREAYRVLKPGGYAAVFASTRTYDLMVISLRLAGFQVIDTLMWMNSQGFPKSMNISKQLEKAGHPELAAKYDGYGNALKPAHEPIALVRKPLEGRYVDNVLAHGTGVLNIDACRIKNTNTDPEAVSRDGEASAERRYTGTGGTNFAATPGPRGGAPEGRYPSNVLFSHDPACVSVGQVTVKAPVFNRFTDGAKPFGGGAGHPYESVVTGDLENNEALAVYACVLGCPVRELDNQSGVRSSGKPGTYRGTPNRSAAYGAESRKVGEAMTGYGDSGGASRFFPTFGYVKKATQKERPTVFIAAKGCVEAGHSPDPHDPTTRWQAAASPVETACPTCTELWVAYQHPTVKPPPIMAWLLSLLTPTGGVALDLFAGTGTTGEAAAQTGHDVILIERDPAHVAMIAKRLTVDETVEQADPAPQPSLFD